MQLNFSFGLHSVYIKSIKELFFPPINEKTKRPKKETK